MGFHDLFQRLADKGRSRNGAEAGLQALLGAAAPFYGGGAYLHRFAYESGLKERLCLPVPVISVGNITLGGTGKTPFCLWLVEELKREGRYPAIVTRGYGREDEDRLVVVHDGRRLRASTRTAGDEPVLLASALKNVPVIACADRHRAGYAAAKKFGADTIVLDDGFQHHRLARQGDLVLVDASQPLRSLRVFPRGTLREPVGMLSRAHLIVLTRWNQARCPRRVMQDVHKYAPHVPVVRAVLKVAGLERLSDGKAVSIEGVRGQKVVVLSAVGNPKSVRKSAVEAGLVVSAVRVLEDHAAITRGVVLGAETLRKKAGSDFVLITEKDAVKFRELQDLPPNILILRVKLEMYAQRDRVLALKTVKGRLHARFLRGYLS